MLTLIFAANIILTWQASQGNIPVTGYRVYQTSTPGSYATTYLDVGNVTTKQVVASLPQCFRITAYNGFGESVPSAERCAGPPPEPSALVLSPAP